MKKKMIVLIAVSCFSHGACANDSWTLFDTKTYTTTYQIKDYNTGSTCAPTNGLGYDDGQTDVLGIQDPNIGFECNILISGDGPFSTGYGGDKPCPATTKIAVVGAAKCVLPIVEFNVTEQGTALIWQCENDSLGLDEWDPVAHLSDCKDTKYTRFKDKRNAIPVLVSPQTDADAFYKVYIDPPTDTCIAYICNPETSHPNYNPLSDKAYNLRNTDNYQCVEHNTKCGIYLNDKQMYMPTYYQLDSNAEVFDQKNGTSYRQNAIKKINIEDSISDQEIQEAIKKLFDNEIKGLKSIFEHVQGDNRGSFYQVAPTAFNGQTFSYYCFSEGIKVIVSCPKFFTYNKDDDKCEFDQKAAQDAIDQKQAEDAAAAERAAAEAKDKCATAICEASNGEYNSGTQKCMCGNDVCTSTTSVNGTPYTYCGGTGTKNGSDVENSYCDKNERGEKRLAEGPPRNFADMAAFNAAINTARQSNSCITNDAADDATADTISTLAKTLDAIEDAYGLSKWRTVDGKFNYARLASDATAAVVLGTTGALVTSSVVKKKQVEAGFESLECTVGGQHVGDWGDVFRIDGK